jgi:chromosome partitioning protein
MEKIISLREISEIIQMTPQGAGKLARHLESYLKGNTRHLTSKSARSLLESRGFEYPKKNIMFHSLKGGSTKTSLAYNCAYRFSQLGARTLLVDLDKQANATRSFNLPDYEHVFVDVIKGNCKINDAIVNASENLDILPSSFKNATLEIELVAKRPANPRLYYQRIFEPVRNNYDVTVFDLAPDLNFNSLMCSLYATTICIPTNPESYSVSGTRMTLESLEGLKKDHPDLEQEILIVWSKYDARERNSFHYITDMNLGNSAKVLPVVIRSDAAVKNAQAERKSVFEQTKKTNAKEDIDILAQELLGLRDFFGPKGNA